MKKPKVKNPVGRPLTFDEPLQSQAFTIQKYQFNFMADLVYHGKYQSMSEVVRAALDDLQAKIEKKGTS